MATIKVERNHKLGTEQVREVVERLAKKLEKDLDADYRWEGSTLKFSRSGATGHILVADDRVAVEVKLGLLLSPMKGAIQKSIESEIDGYLRA